MKYQSISLFTITLTLLSLFLGTAWAGNNRNNNLIRIDLEGQNGASGTAIVVSNTGPDFFQLRASGLAPRTRFNVFLTESPTPGSLPTQFIGEFKTNRRGTGRLFVRTEIINAFASANQILENELGIADVGGAGGLANGANTIALNWLRVYTAVGPNGGNVFGSSEVEFGGPLVLTSEEALP